MKDFMAYVDYYRSDYPIKRATELASAHALDDRLHELYIVMRDIDCRLMDIAAAIKGQEGDLK